MNEKLLNPRPRRWLYILFGVLSIWAFLGPLLLVTVGSGGRSREWPPDRPIEWGVFLGVTIGFVVVLVATVLAAARGLTRRPPD
jgi:hypothetical protein